MNNIKPKLDKYDSAILMCTKNHKIKLQYEYDLNFEFKNNNQLLNKYKEIAIVYADSRALPLESVQLDYITKSMLEIFEIVYHKKFKELIMELLKPNFFNPNEKINEKVFIELYGYLQALTMLNDNNEDLFDLDYELVLSYNQKNY